MKERVFSTFARACDSVGRERTVLSKRKMSISEELHGH